MRLTLQERRYRRKKPGGPRTDLGALRQLEPLKAAAQVRAAMDNKEGEVANAAQYLDIAPSTLYNYLDNDPELKNIETSSEREEKEKSEEDD